MIDITTTMNEYNTTGNLQTVYPITFQGATDNNGSPMLRVILTYASTETTRALVYNVDYSLVFEETVPDLDESLNTPVVRGIKLLNEADAASGNHLEIYRSTPFVQGIDFQVGRIDPEQVERGFDLSVLRDQEISTNVSDLKAYVDAQDNAIREIAVATDEKADQAIETANEAKDTADEAKDIAQDAKDTADSFDERLTQAEQDASDAKNTVDNHVADYNNPHEVTKAQVGLGNVDNTADLDKPVIIKSATIPTASADLVGKEYQYFGETNGTYTHGYIYECKAIPTDTLVFTPDTVSCSWADLSAFLQTETADYNSVVAGSMTYFADADLWRVTFTDANGDTVLTYQQYTGDWENVGFVFSGTFADGDVVSFVRHTNSTYVWERVNVQPVTEIIDNVTSTSTTAALSANQGKVLNDRIDDVSGRGRFLSLWNCATGLAETNPPESPYSYKAGDYFVVGTVSSADPAVNYKPNGSSYTTGVASTTVETNEVSVNDTYFYDGTTWKLQSNAQKEVSFSALAGSPYDNTNLASALNSKANTTDIKNATVTINQGGTQKGQFTLNQATDTTIDLSDGQIIQVDTMPTASADNAGRIVQWIGDTVRTKHDYITFTATEMSTNISAYVSYTSRLLTKIAAINTELGITVDKIKVLVSSLVDYTYPVYDVYVYEGNTEYLYEQGANLIGSYGLDVQHVSGQWVVGDYAIFEAEFDDEYLYNGCFYKCNSSIERGYKSTVFSVSITDLSLLESKVAEANTTFNINTAKLKFQLADANRNFNVYAVESDDTEHLFADTVTASYIQTTFGVGIVQTGGWNAGEYFEYDVVYSWDIVLGDLSNLVDIELNSISDGQSLVYDADSGKWVNKTVDALPSQTGQSGKFLTTNGTTASWDDVSQMTATYDAVAEKITFA